ncbi:toprim domain-containing protein [Catellatospora sp. KI3]|uniref:toprim domain-containing protein n=1 Tax=Catellatospora sp. KI3 TaxID=3041620 RepID=UPI002482F18B|nr:toprim domain-containing protein [Catellatospora sp. KI3]MDI1460944.1 toprim domain-containing protein [Catellatospora sp. KI3]
MANGDERATARMRPPSQALLHDAMLTLQLAIADLDSPPAWHRLLDVAARHRGRGARNALLIARQRPDATELATHDRWRARGARVRRGERGLMLLAPLDGTGDAFDVVRVFDVAQTDAVPAPRRPSHDLVPVVAALAALAGEAGLTVRLRQGLHSAVRADRDRVELAAELPLSAAAGLLVAQLALPVLPDGPARSVQASAVAHVVARRFGLQPVDAPVPQPRQWAVVRAGTTADLLMETIAVIIRSADAVTARLERALARSAASGTVPTQRPGGRRTLPRQRPAPVLDAGPDADQGDQAALYAVNAAAAAFYASKLAPSRAAAAYLRSRGITAAADPDSSWQLGVAPAGGDVLLRHLRSLGFTDRVMLDAGLVAASELHGRGLYDVFRDRLVFPVHAPDGRIAGFTGRDLSGRSRAKFYNTPQTPIFHKGELLYGLAPQLRGRRTPTRFLVVEGPTDAIAAHLAYRSAAGSTVVVAPGGTAFTSAQLALLAAAAGADTSLVMCFDADPAGVKALERAYPLAMSWPHGRVLGTGPEGFKDIAELLAARGAQAAGRDLLAAERPLALLGVERALDRAFPDGFHADWPEARVRANRIVAPYLLDAVRHGDVDLLLASVAARLRVAPHEISQGVVQHFEDVPPESGSRTAGKITS